VAVILFRRAGETASPLALNLFKNAAGLVLLALTMLATGTPFVPAGTPWQDWAVLAGSGVAGIALADTLFFASLNRLGAGRTAVVDCLYSPLVILCAFVYLGEPVGPAVAGAAALIGGAIFVGTWDPAAAGGATGREAVLGVAYGAVSMVLMSAAIVAAKPVLGRVDPLWATTLRMAGAFPVLAAQALLPRHRGEVRRALAPGPHWRSMVPGTLVGAYFALVLWVLGFKYASAGAAGVLNQTSTLLVLLLATVFLKEKLTPRRLVAVALGFAGGALVAF
jgi:drug/metabolite transporter (DMT)-like permease